MRCAIASLVGSFVVVAAVALAVSRGSRFGWFMVGFLAGLYIAMVMWVVSVRTYNLTSGALAESSTTELLRKRRGWRVVDNVPFEHFDVDHLAITPGGLIAVETKYVGPGAGEWLDQRIMSAARQAHDSAASARRLIKYHFKRDLPVVPLVVLWGGGASDRLDEFVEVEGVRVVHGDDAELVLNGWDTGLLTPVETKELSRELEAWVAARDRHDAIGGSSGQI
jgi:hypothetical protein